jgi:hypothetical protein
VTHALEDRPPPLTASSKIVLHGRARHRAAEDALHSELDLNEAEVAFGFCKRLDDSVAYGCELPLRRHNPRFLVRGFAAGPVALAQAAQTVADLWV